MPSNTAPSLTLPLAFIPIICSFAALATTALALWVNGVVHEPDEGVAAHLFQLFMAISILTSTAFIIRWLAQNPAATLRIFAIQLVAALAALAPVLYFKL